MVILPIEWIFGYIAMDKWGIFNSYVTNYTRVVFNAIYLPISLVYLTLVSDGSNPPIRNAMVPVASG